MAFSQLLVAGMALATRFEESREVKTVIKEVPKLIAVRLPAASAESARPSPVVSRPPMAPPPLAATQALPAPTPLATPKVAEPRSERLLNEARRARVASDMGMAILKLEEALSLSPDDPSLHYELGLVHEQMGVFDIAAAHYEKVFQMGISSAGALYQKAAAKIRDGFEQPDAMLGKLSLGRVQIFKNPTHESGEQVILTIPVQKAPDEEIDLLELSVTVDFFNRTSRGEIIDLGSEERSWVTEQWISEPYDWADGEETLRMNYVIPKQDEQTEHLFGKRSYHGHVVSLIYGEKVIDIQAWPPALAAKVNPPQSPAGPGDPMFPEFLDTPPVDFDPNLPMLLPHKEP
jgi:hypothetical protein